MCPGSTRIGSAVVMGVGPEEAIGVLMAEQGGRFSEEELSNRIL